MFFCYGLFIHSYSRAKIAHSVCLFVILFLFIISFASMTSCFFPMCAFNGFFCSLLAYILFLAVFASHCSITVQFYGLFCCSFFFYNAKLTFYRSRATVIWLQILNFNFSLNSSDKSASSNSVMKLNITFLYFCLLVNAFSELDSPFLLHVFKLYVGSWIKLAAMLIL